MVSIDTVYSVLTTIINKENNGYVSPSEFNLLATEVQSEIFRTYFEEENINLNRGTRGSTMRSYSPISFNQRQRVTLFSASASLEGVLDGDDVRTNTIKLPSDLYFLESSGITTNAWKIVEEIKRNTIAYLQNTEAAPTKIYPAYEDRGDSIVVYPETITAVSIRYIRKPKDPKWTYTVVGGKEMYAPNSSLQDFELHQSEFSNIVLRMLTYFGINLREAEVTQTAEVLKNNMKQRSSQ